MTKSLTRILILITLLGTAIAVPLIISGATHTMSFTFYLLGISMAIAASIVLLVAWIGALLKTASLRRWGWFVSLLILSGASLVVYSFVGPETSPMSEGRS